MDFKLDTTKKNTWVTADPHLNHDKDFVWEARGYTSVHHHRDEWFRVINEKVKKEDSLIILGDFALNTSEEQCYKLLDAINCDYVYMIWGNHNNPLKSIYKQHVRKAYGDVLWHDKEVYPFWMENICFLGDYIELKVEDSTYILMHYPISVWNKMGKGASMLCGHSHGGFEESRTETTTSKILDCGWDLHKRPLNLEEIDYIMSNKGFKNVDHHTPSNERS